MYVVSEGGDSMIIQKHEFLKFKEFTQNYFKKEREASSADVLKGLEQHNRKLYKTLEKAAGKKKVKGYVGRLLKSIAREGWIRYEHKTWLATPKWGYCTSCFTPLEDVYLIDIDNLQYCHSGCFDEHGAVEHYDSYADSYIFLFMEFEQLKRKYKYYLERRGKNDFEVHLELTMILKDLYDLFNDSEYTSLFLSGGDDGPLASEMYRMLSILQEDAEKLEALLEQCKKVLPVTNEIFSIEICAEVMRKRKRPEVLREFIRTNRKYRSEDNKNKWSTPDSSQRSGWYYALVEDKVLDGKIEAMNEIQCPECNQIVDKKWSRLIPDDFFYCDECYKNLDCVFKFSKRSF